MGAGDFGRADRHSQRQPVQSDRQLEFDPAGDALLGGGGTVLRDLPGKPGSQSRTGGSAAVRVKDFSFQL